MHASLVVSQTLECACYSYYSGISNKMIIKDPRIIIMHAASKKRICSKTKVCRSYPKYAPCNRCWPTLMLQGAYFRYERCVLPFLLRTLSIWDVIFIALNGPRIDGWYLISSPWFRVPEGLQKMVPKYG